MMEMPRHGNGGAEDETFKTQQAASISAPSSPPSSHPANVERVLNDDALALIITTHDLCGSGGIRDRACAWWAAEAVRLGTDWAGVLASVATAVELCRRRPALNAAGPHHAKAR